MRAWFAENRARGWATCPLTENGFVRISSNPQVLPSPIGVDAAIGVLKALSALDGHRFLTDDVSLTDESFPTIRGHRQVTDAHLLAIARRHGARLVTFDAGASALARTGEVQLLKAL